MFVHGLGSPRSRHTPIVGCARGTHQPARLKNHQGDVLSAESLLTLTSQAQIVAQEGSGFHGPTLADFFPPALLFEGTIFEFNRITLVRLISTAVLVLLFWLAARNPKLVPSRGQSLGELAVDFVRTGVAEESLGKELGRRYTPLLVVIFFGVLAMNITGIIPFLNIAGSSVVGVPLVFALISYVAFIVAGVKAQGGSHFLKSQLFPPGVPWPIYIILTPIEFLSTFIIRPATLTVRLVANMLAGHLLLVLCFAATNFLFTQATGAMAPLGALTLAAGFAFTLFEIFVAVLQAYVFTVLTTVYIQLSVESH
ncbi:F0F1 ATP synthase subunit A [Georgenia yuyongxinii]|uniref:ATP synthase subunit a n=1 Tax=Georgenia yuyongxinii TaxID=2589797 RepID=A0A552WLQ3_9MICO|nr:F0F1 ATP synthase subunit A [Georgenia yuyongxinii]TRW43413.1 F0F1 ATP synthase subunit A [Georgenia yuyongxinii]